MLLEEAKERLKKTDINQEQLESLNSLYILLDLDKDDFCCKFRSTGVSISLQTV